MNIAHISENNKQRRKAITKLTERLRISDIPYIFDITNNVVTADHTYYFQTTFDYTNIKGIELDKVILDEFIDDNEYNSIKDTLGAQVRHNESN